MVGHNQIESKTIIFTYKCGHSINICKEDILKILDKDLLRQTISETSCSMCRIMTSKE